MEVNNKYKGIKVDLEVAKVAVLVQHKRTVLDWVHLETGNQLAGRQLAASHMDMDTGTNTGLLDMKSNRCNLLVVVNGRAVTDLALTLQVQARVVRHREPQVVPASESLEEEVQARALDGKPWVVPWIWPHKAYKQLSKPGPAAAVHAARAATRSVMQRAILEMPSLSPLAVNSFCSCSNLSKM